MLAASDVARSKNSLSSETNRDIRQRGSCYLWNSWGGRSKRKESCAGNSVSRAALYIWKTSCDGTDPCSPRMVLLAAFFDSRLAISPCNSASFCCFSEYNFASVAVISASRWSIPEFLSATVEFAPPLTGERRLSTARSRELRNRSCAISRSLAQLGSWMAQLGCAERLAEIDRKRSAATAIYAATTQTHACVLHNLPCAGGILEPVVRCYWI